MARHARVPLRAGGADLSCEMAAASGRFGLPFAGAPAGIHGLPALRLPEPARHPSPLPTLRDGRVRIAALLYDLQAGHEGVRVRPLHGDDQGALMHYRTRIRHVAEGRPARLVNAFATLPMPAEELRASFNPNIILS